MGSRMALLVCTEVSTRIGTLSGCGSSRSKKRKGDHSVLLRGWALNRTQSAQHSDSTEKLRETFDADDSLQDGIVSHIDPHHLKSIRASVTVLRWRRLRVTEPIATFAHALFYAAGSQNTEFGCCIGEEETDKNTLSVSGTNEWQ
jgi:hypothetical protein